MVFRQFASLSAAEVSLLLVALQYAVLTPAWAVAALALPNDRAAAGCWAAYAGGSGLALLMIVLGMHHGEPAIRAMGNILVVAATLALQCGVWRFTGQRRWPWVQVGVLLITVGLAWMAALSADWVPLRIGVVSALWGGTYFWVARDVWQHLANTRRRHWRPLYIAPLLLAGVMLLARTVRAVLVPESISVEVEQGTVLSVGSSLAGLMAALLLQMTLVALVVTRLVERLERLSRYDALTGLLNRRAIDELLSQEEQRARRLSGPLSVLMIDIDHFKRINDSQGHGVGDRALQHLAAVMRSQLREIDHLSRWGGEEFLAVLPATSAADAVVMAERLADRVRSLPLVNDDIRLALTASIGVAEWRGPDDTVLQLLERADAALYQAKRNGRDQVRAAEPAGLDAPVRAA